MINNDNIANKNDKNNANASDINRLHAGDADYGSEWGCGANK